MKRRSAVLAVVGLVGLVGTAVAAPYVASPPQEISWTTPSPFAGCGNATAPGGVNYPNSEVEPWVDVNPDDPQNIASFYQQDRWSNGGAKSNVASVSQDGGSSWTQVIVPVGTVCSASGDYDRASDPWVTFSPDGTLHAMSLVTDADPPTGGFGDNGMSYNRSTDGGLTWEPPQYLIEDTNPRFLNDKNSMTADPNDSNFVYAVWDRLQQAGGDVNNPENRRGLGFKGPIMLARTTNGGDSWEPARKIYESGANKQTIGNQIVVEPAAEGGSVFDFFADITNSSRRRHGIGPVNLSFIRSDNKGDTWTKPQFVADMVPMSLFRFSSTIDPDGGCLPAERDPEGNCPIRGGDLIPEVAVDRDDGTLYAVWMESFFRGTVSPTHDRIAFTQSTDGGQTWSTPIQVNLTPNLEDDDNEQAFTPSVHVADDGTVTVTYYDFRRNTPSAATLETDHWAVHCHAASEDCSLRASWDEETRITPASFDLSNAPYARGWFIGDYMGLASAGDDFVSVFGSTQGTGQASIFESRLTMP